ncbi:MAG: 2-oxo acid dehydrogenase subunit E2 [Acidobacteria bacterium]|nr:2-oxo acid dehydrogenase subunit E2 [Acidobacteriota bacterium]
MPIDFTLPELGENITAGDVLRVLVGPGETIAREQPVLELETDKATIEVPSSVAGVVREIKVKAGDKVSVGQAILSVDQAAGAAGPGAPAGEVAPAAAPAPAASASASAARTEPPAGGQAPPSPAQQAPAPLASSTPGEALDLAASERRDKAGAKEEAPAADTPPRGRKVVAITRGVRASEPAEKPAGPAPPAVPAAPSVRRMARELGVAIDQVEGTGPRGRISIDDVKEHARRIVAGSARAVGPAAEPLQDFSRFGDVERQPLNAVRRKTAAHLSAAWAAIPHVTQHDLADVTELDALRRKYASSVASAGGSLTMTAIAAKVVASALGAFPQFNASLDLARDELVLKKYVHIGIAVDTDRGLLVPVIRDADRKNLTQIAVEIPQLAEKARTRKIALEEMQGGCFSISNLGGLGGSFFTPIVNAPEVAILGMSRARLEPVYRDGQFVPRLMLPLSLSYDHRVIDGADGIRFLRWIVEALEQPFVLTLHG